MIFTVFIVNHVIVLCIVATYIATYIHTFQYACTHVEFSLLELKQIRFTKVTWSEMLCLIDTHIRYRSNATS